MKKCDICGKEYDENIFEKCNIRSIMEKEHVCFNCAFWMEKYALRNEDTFIINGVHHIGHKISKEEKEKRHFIGCGGRNYYVKYNNGEIKHYNDVWIQGYVPKEGSLAKLFEDNATLITEEEFKSNNYE